MVVRAGVVGVGRQGRFHALKYASLPEAELVGVFDVEGDRARAVAEECGAISFDGLKELLARVNCVTIAVPTAQHYSVASVCLAAGVDVLLEKPIATTLEEANKLNCLARGKGCLLQVGHLERFNPALRALDGRVQNPRFIEGHRLAPFVGRGTDVDVVLDLMIHDIDVVASLVNAAVERVDSIGVSVLTPHPDIANARVRFENGCVANLTSSRVSMKRERKIRIFQSDAYISMDYDLKQVRIYRKEEGDEGKKGRISMEEIKVGEGDALRDQIQSFVECVRTRGEPQVDGAEALRALEIALRIRRELTTEP
jgi:predicted dehydrogenase